MSQDHNRPSAPPGGHHFATPGALIPARAPALAGPTSADAGAPCQSGPNLLSDAWAGVSWNMGRADFSKRRGRAPKISRV
eukprot:5626829-Alexandrium_andersonii.AAC.1